MLRTVLMLHSASYCDSFPRYFFTKKKKKKGFFMLYLGVGVSISMTFYCWVSDYFNVTEAKPFQTADTHLSAFLNHILGRMSQAVLMTSHEFLEIEGV